LPYRPAIAQISDSAFRESEFGTQRTERLPHPRGAFESDDADAEFHLSLTEAKARALESSVVMDMASQNVAVQHHALNAARKDFLPKLLNSFSYFHFDSDLGTVLTTPGILNPAQSIAVPVIEQDASLFTAAAIQPITPLLKVREAVNITAADLATAQAQKQFARRELTKGVEQLYFGLLAAQRIHAALEQVVQGASALAAASNSPDAQISVVEAEQNMLTADYQVITLTEQLNQLIGLPAGTILRLEDPPAPQVPFVNAEEAAASAVASSPKIREARFQVEKAEAAVRLAEADYVPTVNAYGFYVNQDSTPTIQNDFTGVGLSASYVLEWGKKNDLLRQRKTTNALARRSMQKEIQDLQLSAGKAFHEANRAEQALAFAQRLVNLRREAKLPTDPFQLSFAIKSRLESELGAIKAELDYHNAVVELRSLAGLVE